MPVSPVGLEGYWRLNEGTGVTSADSSGKGRHLTTLTNVAWTDGPFSKCLSFVDRTVARAAYGAAIDASAWTAFSISWWCNLTLAAPASTWVLAFSRIGLDGVTIYTDQTSAGPLKTVWGRTGGEEYTNTILSAFDATLRHYVLTYDVSSQAWIIYRDGVVKGSGTLTNTPIMPNRHFVLGNYDVLLDTRTWAGLIDEVRLYSRVLTPTEVTDLATHPNGMADDPIWWLKLDEASGTNCVDSSGFGHPGTITGNTVRVPGISGRACRFLGGATDYIVAYSVGAMGASWTISAWLYKDSNPGASVWNWVMSPNGIGARLVVSSVAPAGKFGLLWRDSGLTLRSIYDTVSASLLTWHHVVAWHNNLTTTTKLYVDGVEVATTALYDSEALTAGTATLGSYGSPYPLGIVDEPIYFARALELDEILWLFAHPGGVVGGESAARLPPRIHSTGRR